MEKIKILPSILLVLVITSVVKSECEGVIDCLKAYLAGDIGDEISDSVIKDFEIDNKSVETKIDLVSDHVVEEECFDLFKETNSFFNSIMNLFSFTNNPSSVTVNYTISDTNWTVSYNTNVISDFHETNFSINLLNNTQNKPKESNLLLEFPNVHNATIKNHISKDHQKGLTKLVQNNEISQNFDDETYGDMDDNSTEADYPIIDYISMYEDTTNELIESPTTHNPKIIVVGSNFNKNNETLENNSIIIGTNSQVLETSTEDYFYKNPSELLSEALDDYVELANEDKFEDYPEVDYVELYKEQQATATPETTTFQEIDATTDSAVDERFSLLGIPAEGVMICKGRRAFFMNRLIGLPFDVENYYDASFQSGSFKGLKRVDLVVEFMTVANVTMLWNNSVVTRINDTTYSIRGLDPSKSVDFKVQAPPGVGFPFLKKMTLNGREICKEKRQWRPTVFGSQNQAVISPLHSPNQQGIYYCGRSQINFAPLVVKGLPTKEGDYPWHVALFRKNRDSKNWDYACGGTILHRKTIITAAHCVVGKDGVTIDKKKLLLVAGKYRIFEVDSYQIPLKISKVIVHENYTNTPTTIANDLALLIIEEHLDYGQYIQPICQWNSKQEEKEIVYQEYGTVVGWGATENDTLSETLLAASMRVIPDNLCLKSRPSFFKRYISGNTFCAGNKNGTSACNGDSGGGLIFPIREMDGKTSWYLRGVVSVGVRRAGGLCDPEHYVVFTDVVRYREWIEQYQEL